MRKRERKIERKRESEMVRERKRERDRPKQSTKPVFAGNQHLLRLETCYCIVIGSREQWY